MSGEKITVACGVEASLEAVWEAWVSPEHIVHWNAASEDWHTPTATNDLRRGGRFLYRMEARDGSMGFDFGGEYLTVEHLSQIHSRLDDGRSVRVTFRVNGAVVEIEEVFEADPEHPLELHRAGWQNILDRFKRYVEVRESTSPGARGQLAQP